MRTIASEISKRISLFFLSLLLTIFSAHSETNLSGTITKDSTLNMAGSPYIVSSYLTVNSGTTLSIESGVTLKFQNNVSFYIYGTLNASGVVFTSDEASPVPGSWGQLYVGDWSNAGIVNLTSCQLNYYSQFYINNGTVTLTNTDLANSANNGITLNQGVTANISNGTISTSNVNALNNYDGINATSGSTLILSGTQIQNFNNGLSIENGANVNISGVILTSCYYPIRYNGSGNLTVNGMNTLTGNTYDAVKINFNYLNSNLILPTITVPYLFPWFNVQTQGKLTIASNNSLKFDDNAQLYIEGVLVAKANSGEKINFTSSKDDNVGGDTNKDGTSSAPKSQDWRGIYFQDTSVDSLNVMYGCNIRYAGGNQQGGINTYNSSPSIDSCDISNNYIGIYMQGASNPILIKNTIGSSQMTPLAMSFEADPIMKYNILSFSDNAYDAIGIIGGDMIANGTLKKRTFTNVPNITYFLLDQITIPKNITLTIDKGITIKSYSDYGPSKRIVVNGTLIANATVDSIINFTSARDDNYGYPADCNKDGTITSPVTGDWGGIIFNPGSTGNMNFCRLKYARIRDYSFINSNITEYVNYPALALIDANPTISNCEFKDLAQAISCYRSASPALSNLTFTNILFSPINISSSANPTITNITFTNVGWRAIGLIGGNVALNGAIHQREVAGYANISYILLSDMNINSGTQISIDPGVVIKGISGYFDNYNYYFDGKSIFVDGGFKTDGTVDQPVIFTSLKDDNVGNPGDTNGDGNATSPMQGDWGSIKFRATSDDMYCQLNYTQLKYAGYTNEGALTIENAAPKIKNCLFSNSSNYGIYCNGNSMPTIDSVNIINCGLDPIAMSLTSNPNFANILFKSNFSQAIKIIEGTLSTNATLSPRNIAGINNIAYIVDQLTISSNAKLTILPDVVVKFRGNGNTYLKVYGNLIANGTATDKIYFTSFKDDSKGGDSNNNGNIDSPAKGDWGQGNLNYWNHWDETSGGIKFENNSQVSDTVNSLNYCEISYPSTGIRIENAYATIANTTVQLCNYFGGSIAGSANPNFNNCQFYNINYTPIELSMFSEPTFDNCTALNVGYMGLGVIPETFSKSAVIPVRNFGGYNNINYLLEGVNTISSGSTITIPEGIVFKSAPLIWTANSDHNLSYSWNLTNGFVVNGKIMIDGTADKPVIFTNADDDDYGSPSDMNQNGKSTLPADGKNNSWSGNWIEFNDVSDDSSEINHAILKYGAIGINTHSASPLIKNTRFENLYYGIDMSGVSNPLIDSCIFNNLQYFPIQISLVSFPSSTLGNIISGSTYKVIKVRDEVLTQDVKLPKRNFGNKNNIPYLFNNYQIGTSASLDIAPGVICKFMNRDWGNNPGINVLKGFTALGGSTPDSTIVFTSISDDFYGGDSNADSTMTAPAFGNWNGINFDDQSLDPLCKMKNCIIRYAQSGVSTVSASPSFESCNFSENEYGAKIIAASNPTFSNCDFSQNKYFGIYNIDKSFSIDAQNCWWGNNSGPIQTDTESESYEQQHVSSFVNYTPWKDLGAINPITGDVSLNGIVQAYDASLILKFNVGSIVLNNLQKQVADVSGNFDITAYDASLILQYVVGINSTFPLNKVKKQDVSTSIPTLKIGNYTVDNTNEFSIPIQISPIDNMLGTNIQLHFNPLFLKAISVDNSSNMYMEYKIDNSKGIIAIALASSLKNNNENLAKVSFIPVAPQNVTTEITVDKFLFNESDLTFAANQGTINIVNAPTQFSDIYLDKHQGFEPIFPNPVKENSTIKFYIDNTSKWVNIAVFDIVGKKVETLINQPIDKGFYTLQLIKPTLKLNAGSYILRMQTENYHQSQIFQVYK